MVLKVERIILAERGGYEPMMFGMEEAFAFPVLTVRSKMPLRGLSLPQMLNFSPEQRTGRAEFWNPGVGRHLKNYLTLLRKR